jgi:hypothetical protein
MKLPAHSLLVLAAALACASCDDPSLITVETPDGSGVFAGDARADATAFDLAACEACFMAPDTPGPGCATEWATCNTPGSLCGADFMCLETTGCFGKPESSFISCGLPCSNSLTSGSSDYTAIVDLFECITKNACNAMCFAP